MNYNYIDYYRNSEESGYNIDIDFKHIEGNWKSPEDLRKSLIETFKNYGIYDISSITAQSYSDKDFIHIFMLIPGDSVYINEDEHDLEFSFDAKVNNEWHRFTLSFAELNGVVSIQLLNIE